VSAAEGDATDTARHAAATRPVRRRGLAGRRLLRPTADRLLFDGIIGMSLRPMPAVGQGESHRERSIRRRQRVGAGS
jgi:hypothetical protein